LAPPTVLSVAPHCDDEVIGAPATLFALRDRGWRVVNLTTSLGSAADSPRRLSEVTEACRRAGFELVVADPPLGDPLRADQLPSAQAALERELETVISRWEPLIVMAPSPHDRHPGHEVVGRAVTAVLEARRFPVELWMWGLWADLAFPTLVVPFGAERLEEVLRALEAHAGELERNDYRRLVSGRATMNASLGPERVFGFGSSATGFSFAELVMEVHLVEGRWLLGSPCVIDSHPRLARGGGSPGTPTGRDVTAWMHAPSITSMFGPPGPS